MHTPVRVSRYGVTHTKYKTMRNLVWTGVINCSRIESKAIVELSGTGRFAPLNNKIFHGRKQGHS